MNKQRITWRKSRHSEAGSACVEVARLTHDTIAVRDSKNTPAGPILKFTRHEWAVLLQTLHPTDPDQ